jgi:hypothetical protein
MARRGRLVNKALIKRIAGKCRLCPEPNYEALDVHRIIPGEMGGEYTYDNVVVLCSRCHRLVHVDKFYVIDRWYMSTAGRLLRVFVGPERLETFF